METMGTVPAYVQTQLGRRHSPGPLPPYVLERSGSLYTASRSSSQCEPLPENAILDTPPDHVSGGPMGSREILLQVQQQLIQYKYDRPLCVVWSHQPRYEFAACSWPTYFFEQTYQ